MHQHHRTAVRVAIIALLASGLNNHSAHSAQANISAPSAAASFDVAAENAKPGTSGWHIAQHSFTSRTLAFADHQSVLPDASFGVYVSCAASHFTVSALRIGAYGGNGAREVWRSAQEPCAVQRHAVIDPATHASYAPWRKSLEVTTTGWPEGMYVLKVAAADGSATYVDLVLRSASTAGRIVLVSATQTFQAYNKWGGGSTYTGKRGFKSRARVVSYDRPNTWGFGSGKFMKYEAPLFTRAEALGLPLAYLADTDISADPAILDGALSVVTGGHSEYWTQTQRDAMRLARSKGTNLLFFGANTSYWRVRLSASSLGSERVLTVYKNRREDPRRGQPTIRFRDAHQPDAQLLGGSYNCFPASGRFTVTDSSSWVFAGTGVRNGSSFTGIIGPEVDWLAKPASNVHDVAHSTVRCGKRRSYASLTIMRDPSGAATIDIGTMGWVLYAMDRKAPAVTRDFVRTVTDNILRAGVNRGLR